MKQLSLVLLSAILLQNPAGAQFQNSKIMKKILILLTLILFAFPSFAQIGANCPAVDWVRTVTSDTDMYLYARRLPTKDGGEMIVGYYYKGCTSIAGKSVPPLQTTKAEEWGNMFLMKADSNDKAEWVLPFEVIDAYKNIGYPVGFSFQFFMDAEDNAHIIVRNNLQKFEFLGKSYGLAQSGGLDSNGNMYEYYFKVSSKGQLLKEFGFKIWAGGEYMAPPPSIIYVNSSDSSMILIYKNTGKNFDSVSILDMPKIPTI